MANNLLPGATTLFLLLLTLATADTDSDLVLDIDGNPLEVGSEYFISRAIFFGWIGRAPISSVCPQYVVEHPSQVTRGDPVKFVPVNGTQKEIHLSSDVQIDSGWSALCRSDGFWRLASAPPIRSSVFTAAGGSNTSPSSFRIESTAGTYRNAYRIAFSQWYLTVFIDHSSGLKLVGFIDNPALAAVFFFYKNNKDVVSSI